MKKSLFIAILVVAITTMACGININWPLTQVKTGPVQTEDISVPVPDITPPIKLTLSFGAGKINITPGAEKALVSGTATYNVQDFKPVIKTDKNEVSVEQGNLNIKGFPDFKENIKNEWSFKLGATPLDLKVNAGAYSGQFELGGLSLKNVDITDGASDVSLEFSKPNDVEMDTFSYHTGASTVSLEGLGNADFATMIFRSGAGSYKLDFSGEIKRDAVVSIESGISSLTLVVPEGIPANVSFEGGLSNVDVFGSWKKSSDTAYTQEGTGPKLTILIKMSAGSLQLRNK